ncbi:tRNA threonylcarbamoyladenosine dehydratase [bacterium]|nr:tRNA threonylcarbamoyladenosine dehydratase [bacterium]
MTNQFSRTELLIGKESVEKLGRVKVAVFGLGGVGGYVVEALARSGVGSFVLVDNDKVSLTNLNRQIYALHSTLGKDKTDVAKARILDINPSALVEVHNTFYSPENASEFEFSEYDYVVDAIDTVKCKLSLVEECYKANTPIISSMGAGNKLNPMLFEVSDIYKTSVCPLSRVMRGELKKRKIPKLKVVYSKEEPFKPTAVSDEQDTNRRSVPSSNAFVPSVCGLIIAGEVILDLIKP